MNVSVKACDHSGFATDSRHICYWLTEFSIWSNKFLYISKVLTMNKEAPTASAFSSTKICDNVAHKGVSTCHV